MHPKSTANLVDCTCLQCGALFTRPAWEVAHLNVRYCSWACSNVARSKPRTGSLAERFVANIDKNGPLLIPQFGPCWMWTGAHKSNGYGKIYVGGGSKHGRSLMAHRVAWEMASGVPIPPGLDVLHICDNPSCARNDEHGVYILDGVEFDRWGHLFLGTDRDNNRDKVLKGRLILPPKRLGAKNNRTILTEEQVLAIRASAGVSQREMARQYGVTQSAIAAILHRRSWSHI